MTSPKRTFWLIFRGLLTAFLLLILTAFAYVLLFIAERNTALTTAMIYMVSGGLLMMAIYSIMMFLFRPEEKAALYFSLFCMGNCVRFGLWNLDVSPIDLAAAQQNILLLLRQTCVYLMFFGLAGFVFEVFAQHSHRRLRRVILCVPVILLLGVFNDFLSPQLIHILFLVIGLLSLITMILLIAQSPIRRGQRIYLLYLVVFVLYVISFMGNATFFAPLRNFPVVTNNLLAIVHLVVLSDRYARAIRAVEIANQELEQKVAERTAELVLSERSVRDMVADITHDIKTPLSVLSVNLEMLTERTDTTAEEKRRYTEIAYQKSLDLRRLTRNLFGAAQMEAGQVYDHLGWYPLCDLMEGVYEKYSGQTQQAGIDLSVGFARDCALWLDKEKIWSVLDNIIANAMRHTPSGGRIGILAAPPADETVSLSITDTGSGIAPEDLPHVFRRHYMADKSRGGGGESGLGLFIVKTTMEGMGGQAQARSVPGGGAEIILTFPVQSTPSS